MSTTDNARAEAEAEAEERADNLAAWNSSEYVAGYKYGFIRGAEWATLVIPTNKEI